MICPRYKWVVEPIFKLKFTSLRSVKSLIFEIIIYLFIHLLLFICILGIYFAQSIAQFQEKNYFVKIAAVQYDAIYVFFKKKICKIMLHIFCDNM